MKDDVIDVSDAISGATASVMESFTGSDDTETSTPAPKTKRTAPAVTPVEEDEELDEQEDGDEDGDTEDEQEEEAPELPEGFVSAKTITDRLVTDFAVRDTEGEEVEIPALTIEYKANGKVRRDRLDQVVKLAQFGVYNAEREQSLLRQQEEAESVLGDYSEKLNLRESQLRRLLEDEEAYIAARERYLQENAPEKRASRAEQEAKRLREETTTSQFAARAEQFYSQRVLPAIDEIAAENPEVELEEITAQFQAALVPVMRNGVVPPAVYGAVENYIATQLREWAAQKNASRVSRYRGQEEVSKKKVEAAKVAAAKAKRAVATAAKPGARSGISTREGERKVIDPKKYSVEDAQEDAVSSALAAIRGL